MNTLTTRPSRIRWLILALLFLISVVTYIDRVNISVTARQMMPAYGMTDQEMGWVFSAFVVGYALFQIPGGWLADRWGVRVVLTVALLWWSICTALTAMVAASSLASLVGIIGALMLVRFCLGMGEAVALPAFNRAVTNWFPADARGFGIGIAIGGIGLGSAMTPPIAAWVMVNWGWQTVFYLASLLGIGMGLLWWLLSRNHPHEHPWVNAGEQALLKREPTSHHHSRALANIQTDPHHLVAGDQLQLPRLCRLRLSVLVLSLSCECPRIRRAPRRTLCLRLPFWPCWCFVPWAAG